ncbi:hypothetical protein MO867_18680 [Microbulbifer sp. OS29]|uniref:Uncharacterized protein n=1 Tax=Microbulbifer okhotskensis TaxID=2926617 RepID=A0A9X2EQ78_9GAMM|nr:hypothetical protein [Microbulbifer okhotskensis]MCO1336362.1 hypothetical protein [Microbulbifer okhotskensis]
MELFGQSGNFVLINIVSGNIDFDLRDDNPAPCENIWVGNSSTAPTDGECI